MSANVAALLAERAAEHPERAALVEGGGRAAVRLTYAQLERRVRGLAAGLARRGLRPGDPVLLFVPMSTELYVALLACLHAGGSAVFVDAWADRRRLDAAVRLARPRVFIGSPRAQLLRLLSPAVRAIPQHLTAGPGPFSLRRHERPGGTDAVDLPGDTPALVTFTTGSTGAPKAAARSHAFLWAQHRALAAHLRPRPGDVDMPTLPVFVLSNLASGLTTVLPRFDPRRPAEIRPARILRQMEAEGVTTASGSPAFFERLARWCEAHGRRIPVRALHTGGAPVLPPLAELLVRATAGEVGVVYGSTEAEPISGISARELAAAGADGGVCVGRPVPQIRLRLLRVTDGPAGPGLAGWEAAPGEAGEIAVAGAHVLGGYLGDPAADARHKIRDGDTVWHRTGDAGRLDAAGRLWLLGRVSERVERDGRTWWSGEVEARAGGVPGILHAAYLAVPGPAGRAVLCVETPSGRLDAPAAHALRSAVHPAPADEIRTLRRIPRDPRHASRTDRESLRRLLGTGRA